MIGAILKGHGRCERVLRLLDSEKAILLDGPIAELGPVVEQREALLAELLSEGAELPEDFLAAVKAKAERNCRLLLASLAGLKAARAHVESAERARSSFRTYNAAGAPVEVASPAATRDQRR